MRAIRGVGALAIMGLATGGQAVGEEAATPARSEQQVTVTATRSEKPVLKAPATVSVISAQVIENHLAHNVKDLIRFEPGVSVRSAPARFTAAGASTGRDGNSSFNIRGLEGNRVLIQVDGVRMPDAYSFGAQAVGRGDYLDLDILKAVEIVRGPSSALYGSDGVAGSVSFITKDPADLLQGRPWSVSGRAGYASVDETRSRSLITAGQMGAWEGMLVYTRREGEGQKTAGENHSPNVDRTVANPEDNRSNAVLGKVVYAFNPTNRLRLTWDHLDRDVDWNVLSALAKPPLSSTSTLALAAADDMRRDRFTLDHRLDLDAGPIRAVHASLYYQDSHTRQFSSEDRNTALDRIRDTTFDNALHGATVELSGLWDRGGVQHHFIYGIDYSRTRQESTRDGTVPPVGETFPTHAFPTTDYSLVGAFLQDEIRIGRLTLYPAVRWDYFEIKPTDDDLFVSGDAANQSDSRVSPKIGMVFELTDRVNVFANAAAGFKAPAPSQVNNGFTNPIQNYRSISNPDLKPETSRTLEAGLRFNSETFTASIAGFTGRYRDFIDQVSFGDFAPPPAPPVEFQYVNLDRARIKGAEFRTEARLPAGFFTQLAGSYTEGTSTRDGEETPLQSIDPWKLIAGLGWRSAADTVGGQLYATHSAGKSEARAGIECSPACFLPNSFTVLDLTAWWQATDNVIARIGVFNLTDEKYWWWSDARGLSSTSAVRDAYTQPGRNASASLTLRF